jgi:hypothetical protein
LGYIYSKEQIEKERKEAYFPREYCGQYIGVIGDVFSQESIQNAQTLGQKYDPEKIIANCQKTIGVDPSYGSSNFAIVATQYVNGQIQVIFADEFHRPDFIEMIQVIMDLKKKLGHVSNIYVDAANPEVWESLKREIGEPYNETYIKETMNYCTKYNLDIENRMCIIPVPFSVENASMLQHAKALVDDGHVAINPRFDKLITALTTAVAQEYKLQKKDMSYDDIMDAFRLSLLYYKFQDEHEGNILIAKSA